MSNVKHRMALIRAITAARSATGRTARCHRAGWTGLAIVATLCCAAAGQASARSCPLWVHEGETCPRGTYEVLNTAELRCCIANHRWPHGRRYY